MEEQYRLIIDLCLRSGASCVYHTMAEQEVEDILRCPLVAVASDSGIRSVGTGQPHQYATGIVHVIVNGYPALRDGEMTGLLPGRPVPGAGSRPPESAATVGRAADAPASGR